jgi:hypothetical protein
LWVPTAVPTVVLAVLITVVLPPKQTLDNLGDWAFRLSPLLLAVLTIALLPRWRVAVVFPVLATVGFMGVLDTGLVLRILSFGAAPEDQQDAAFEGIYQFQLLLAAFVVLSGLLAFRMGGARSTAVLKAGVASVLIVISGLNDVTFWLTYDWPDGRPDRFGWASHIIVFVGGPPTAATAVVFMVVHFVLAAAVIVAPLGRLVDRALTEESAS